MTEVAITAWMGMTVRNLFYGKTLDELNEKYKLTIVSYYSDELRATFPAISKNTKFIKIAIPRWRFPSMQGKFVNLLSKWNQHGILLRHNIHTVNQWLQPEKDSHRYRYYFHRLIGGHIAVALRRHNEDNDYLRDAVYLIPLQKELRSVDALFVASTDIPKDQQLIYTFRKVGIPVIALVHSWDNLTSKGLLSASPDRLLVWNEIMLQEAIRYHGIPRERIDIVGVPQYETYRQISSVTNEDNFRARLHIPGDTAIITYTASSESMFPEEERFVEELLLEVSNGTFGNATLVLRIHPPDVRKEVYCEKYSGTDLPIRLDFPDPAFTAFNIWSIGTEASLIEFVELMKFSNVVINLSSTITLDAVLFDTPVICLNFNYRPDNEWNAAHMHHKCEHYRPIVESEAVEFPNDMQELIGDIHAAIKYPLGKTKRRRQLANCMMPELQTSLLITQAVEKAIKESKRVR